MARLAIALLIVAFGGFGCGRSEKKHPRETAEQAPPEAADPMEANADRPIKVSEGYAVWYGVPRNSLAWRRGGIGELTAAHNRLPIGTRVRVTHLGNGKSVLVRITDHGITNRKAKIDLCKEAAEQLDMIGEGIARVRLEILPDDEGSALAKSQKVRSNP